MPGYLVVCSYVANLREYLFVDSDVETRQEGFQLICFIAWHLVVPSHAAFGMFFNSVMAEGGHVCQPKRYGYGEPPPTTELH